MFWSAILVTVVKLCDYTGNRRLINFTEVNIVIKIILLNRWSIKFMIYITFDLFILHNTTVNIFVPRLLSYHIIKKYGFFKQSASVGILIWQHSRCVILGKSLNFPIYNMRLTVFTPLGSLRIKLNNGCKELCMVLSHSKLSILATFIIVIIVCIIFLWFSVVSLCQKPWIFMYLNTFCQTTFWNVVPVVNMREPE